MAKRCNEQRLCETCGQQYTAKVVTTRFCSRRCMYEWRSTLPKPNRETKPVVEKVLGQKDCPQCDKQFDVTKSRKKLCSRSCMYEWRKAQNWEIVECIGCNAEFSRRKKDRKQYCTNDCSRKSLQKREKLRKWGLSKENHWSSPEAQAKGRATKKKRYGDANYNNLQKNIQTCMDKYGKPYAILVSPKANGKRISKVQRFLYEQVKQQYPDAELEWWLRDAQKSVDIFIPSRNKVIEIYGTYWHCDPRKYDKDYFNKSVKMTAEEIWKRDDARTKYLEMLGYQVEIKWENDA